MNNDLLLRHLETRHKVDGPVDNTVGESVLM